MGNYKNFSTIKPNAIAKNSFMLVKLINIIDLSLYEHL